MTKRFILLIALIATLVAALACAPAALADEMLCQSYDAPLFGSMRRVNVYRIEGARATAGFEPNYRIEIDGFAQSEPMIFTNAESPADVELLRFVDVNFDGYTDIAALRTAGATDLFADFFVYEPQNDAFARAEALEALSLYRAELYPAQGLMLNYIHDGAATGTWELLKWAEGGNLETRLLRTSSVLFAGDDMTELRATVIDYAADGTQTIMYDSTLPASVDAIQYNAAIDNMLGLLWQGFDSTETPMTLETMGTLVYTAQMLYYNPNGGQYYHQSAYCPSVSDKYLPLAAFDGARLSEAPFNQLKPCNKCASGN